MSAGSGFGVWAGDLRCSAKGVGFQDRCSYTVIVELVIFGSFYALVRIVGRYTLSQVSHSVYMQDHAGGGSSNLRYSFGLSEQHGLEYLSAYFKVRRYAYTYTHTHTSMGVSRRGFDSMGLTMLMTNTDAGIWSKMASHSALSKPIRTVNVVSSSQEKG